MVDAVWGRLRTSRVRRPRRNWLAPFLHGVSALRWVAAAAVLALLAYGVAAEIRSSFLQSVLFSRLDRHMTFKVTSGPSQSISLPAIRTL